MRFQLGSWGAERVLKWAGRHQHRRCPRALVQPRPTRAASTGAPVLPRGFAAIVVCSFGCSAPRPPPGPLETMHFGSICPSELVEVRRVAHPSAAAPDSVRDPLVPHDRFLPRDVGVGHRFEQLLDVFEEPSLARDGCRFVASPSFGALSMGRIVDTGGEAIVTVKVAERSPGQGRLAWRRLKRVARTDFRQFADAVARAGFWNMPTLSAEIPQQDGLQMYLECRRGDEHHLVSRASGVVESLCGQIVALGECAKAHPQ